MTRRMRVRGFSCMGLCAAAVVALAQGQQQQAPPASSPFGVAYLAPLLASWIASERDAAKEQGVEPIPAPIRAALAGYVPDAILDAARWRIGGTQLSMPQNMIRFGHASAVTLDNVVVFESRELVEDPKLWAHELKHVMQFAEWGLEGFATRYLSNYNAIENEAYEFRWQFMKKAGLIPPVESPQP